MAGPRRRSMASLEATTAGWYGKLRLLGSFRQAHYWLSSRKWGRPSISPGGRASTPVSGRWPRDFHTAWPSSMATQLPRKDHNIIRPQQLRRGDLRHAEYYRGLYRPRGGCCPDTRKGGFKGGAPSTTSLADWLDQSPASRPWPFRCRRSPGRLRTTGGDKQAPQKP